MKGRKSITIIYEMFCFHKKIPLFYIILCAFLTNRLSVEKPQVAEAKIVEYSLILPELCFFTFTWDHEDACFYDNIELPCKIMMTDYGATFIWYQKNVLHGYYYYSHPHKYFILKNLI